MIEWYKDIITDDVLSDCSDEVICKIINRQLTMNIYCVCLASNEKNLIDIINANEFRFPHYDRISTKVIGICKGKDNAVQMVKKLIEDVYKQTESYDIRLFFKDKEFWR